MTKRFTLTIWHDEDTDDPFDYDTLFRMHSFKRGDWHESDAGGLGDFENKIGFWLSHHEHGLRAFFLRDSKVARFYPDMQWDGVHTAGFLEVIAGEESAESKTWWDDLDDDRKLELAEGMIEIYTDWLNGNTYGYTLQSSAICDMGHEHNLSEPDVFDSCGGFIGTDGLEDDLRITLDHYGATEENTRVIDRAYGMADYLNLWKLEDANA